mgnify:CR=1 FL=1
MEEKVLTAKERAYILDKIGNTSYFEEFGDLEDIQEKELVVSIFKKLEFTYYIPSGSKYFHLTHFDFSEKEAKEALADLESFKKVFEGALDQ